MKWISQGYLAALPRAATPRTHRLLPLLWSAYTHTALDVLLLTTSYKKIAENTGFKPFGLETLTLTSPQDSVLEEGFGL